MWGHGVKREKLWLQGALEGELEWSGGIWRDEYTLY